MRAQKRMRPREAPRTRGARIGLICAPPRLRLSVLGPAERQGLGKRSRQSLVENSTYVCTEPLHSDTQHAGEPGGPQLTSRRGEDSRGIAHSGAVASTRQSGHYECVELTPGRRRRSGVNRFVCALAGGLLITACSSSAGKSTTPTSRPATPTTSAARTVAEGSPQLLAACNTGARAYSGAPIAAFKDPSDAGIVICWADGHVSKSPPPGPGGSVPPDFNRLVFKTTLDGKHFVLTEAGYRSSMPVKAPTTSYGTITGRYYADGGPPPLGYTSRPIPGTITVTNVRSHQTYRPRENSGGYFTLNVPVGTYEVAARSRNIAGAMTKIVTVPTGQAVDADLGIHMT